MITTKDKITGVLQLLIVVVFIVLSFIVASSLKTEDRIKTESTAGDAPLPVRVISASPTDEAIQFQTTGIVTARNNITVVPQVSGRITSVSDKFYVGGRFEEGEILFTIDPTDFELEIQRLESNVSSAKTSLELARAESEAAKKEWKATRGKREIPDLVAKLPQLEEAEATLLSAQAQLENARLDLERTSVSMPFSGQVLSSNVEVGQVVSAGQSYGEVYDAQHTEIQSSLDEAKLYWLKQTSAPNIEAHIKTPTETLNFSAQVKRISDSLDEQTRFATVTFSAQTNDHQLSPGQFVSIDVEGQKFVNSMKLPLSVYQKDSNIYVLDDDNKIQFMVPDILYQNDDVIVITNVEHDLKIITTQLSGAIEGTVAKVVEE